MCLSRVDLHTKHIRTGYKVVWKESRYGLFPDGATDVYFPECRDSNKPLPLNKWLSEEDYRTSNSVGGMSFNSIQCTNQDKLYPTGFHTFVTQQGAKSWQAVGSTSTTVIVKVKVKDCVASGYQRCGLRWHRLAFYRTVVAKRIKIVEVLP